MDSGMGDVNDEEIGLLSETQAGSRSVAGAPSGDASLKPTRWSAGMTILIFAGLLAMILTVLYGDVQMLSSMWRGDGSKTLDAPFNVLVVGDWGRQGKYNQTLVANQMGIVGKQLDVNFIISAGDNFYDSGLLDSHDELFTKSFSEIYQAPSLQRTWYAVLGNHDYRGNPEAQVDKHLTSRDSRWFCDYTYTLRVDLGHVCNGGMDMPSSLEFFFIDTNPFEEDYWTPNSVHYTWTRSTPRHVVIANQLKNLTEALEASTATWKLVVGHHTMFSYGNHGNTPELVEKIFPILNANKVDLYINGHDHSLQHIKRSDSEVHFVTTGGGSKAWKGVFDDIRPDSKLYYDGQGFISISVTSTNLLLNYYDITGTVLHQIALKK